MPDSQSSEPGFEVLSIDTLVDSAVYMSTCHLAIDSGEQVRIAAWLECFPEKPSWCRNEQVCQGGQKVYSALSGPMDWILYKKYLFKSNNDILECKLSFLTIHVNEHFAGIGRLYHNVFYSCPVTINCHLCLYYNLSQANLVTQTIRTSNSKSTLSISPGSDWIK